MDDYKIGEQFEIMITAPITFVKTFIKSKWRKDGWKLIQIRQKGETYWLKFEKRKVQQRRMKE